MTAQELYERMEARVSELTAAADPRKRHIFASKLIYVFRELVHEIAPTALASEFEDIMFEHGYHRRVPSCTP